jgi:hypothetical protein
MYLDAGPLVLGLPAALWAFLMVGAIGGFFAGRWFGYNQAVKNHVLMARDRDWMEIDRLRALQSVPADAAPARKTDTERAPSRPSHLAPSSPSA